MNKRLMVALGIGLAVVASACDDGFLTTVPPDQVNEEQFWRTEQDGILAVNAIYPITFGFELIYFDAASDNAWQAQGFGGWYPIGNGSVDAGSGTTSAFWRDGYRAIRRANELLANIDRIQFITPGLKERLKGEARFLRAYHYDMLANLFGDVPLVLEPLGLDEGQVTRTPRAEVADTVLADLTYAASVLPVSYPAADRGRATKGAALALKARAALYEARWQVAADAAKAVMDLGVYTLYPNYRDLFTYRGEGNSEVIFDEQYIQNQRANSVFSELAPSSVQGLSRVVPLRSLVDEYEMIDGLPIGQSPLYRTHPDSMYLNRDPRFYGSILYPGATFAGAIYNSRPDSVAWSRRTADQVLKSFDATATGYQVLKFVDPTDGGSNRSNSGLNMIVIRYADVLLMYAEAKIELGQIDASVEGAIDQVRQRAGMPPIATGLSQAQLRDAVRHERRVELALEGLRLFDIRRWRIAEQVMAGQTYGFEFYDQPSDAAPGTGTQRTFLAEMRRFTLGRDYLWPVPRRELLLNPELTQNPGY
jgi:hypothetical protein